jgi:hypothetical protein
MLLGAMAAHGERVAPIAQEGEHRPSEGCQDREPRPAMRYSGGALWSTVTRKAHRRAQVLIEHARECGAWTYPDTYPGAFQGGKIRLSSGQIS